jgi:hypothetical protein
MQKSDNSGAAAASTAGRTADGGPSGLGGWLLLIPIGLASGVYRMSRSVLLTGIHLLSDDRWRDMLSSPAYHPLLLPLLLCEALASALFVLGSIALLYLFFRKSRRFPPAFILYLSLNVVYLLTDRLVGGMIPVVAEVLVTRAALVELGVAIAVAAIWIPYTLRSRRVRNTFVAGGDGGPTTPGRNSG